MKRVITLIGVLCSNVAHILINNHLNNIISILNIVSILVVSIAVGFIFTSKDIQHYIFIILCDSIIFGSLVTWIVISVLRGVEQDDIYFVVIYSILSFSLLAIDFVNPSQSNGYNKQPDGGKSIKMNVHDDSNHNILQVAADSPVNIELHFTAFSMVS
jgi:hypothetical protein